MEKRQFVKIFQVTSMCYLSNKITKLMEICRENIKCIEIEFLILIYLFYIIGQ